MFDPEPRATIRRCAVDQDQCTRCLERQCLDMSDIHRLPEKWLPVSIAPSDVDLEVGVIDKEGIHALVFPVRKSGLFWVDASTKNLADIAPTHWRKWQSER